MENKVIKVDRRKLFMTLISLFITSEVVFISGAFSLFSIGTENSLSNVLVIVGFQILIILILSIFILDTPSKIEYNDQEITAHRIIGKLKFRFDEKPVAISEPGLGLVNISKYGFTLTTFSIPKSAENLDEIIALFKRIGNQ